MSMGANDLFSRRNIRMGQKPASKEKLQGLAERIRQEAAAEGREVAGVKPRPIIVEDLIKDGECRMCGEKDEDCECICEDCGMYLAECECRCEECDELVEECVCDKDSEDEDLEGKDREDD